MFLSKNVRKSRQFNTDVFRCFKTSGFPLPFLRGNTSAFFFQLGVNKPEYFSPNSFFLCCLFFLCFFSAFSLLCLWFLSSSAPEMFSNLRFSQVFFLSAKAAPTSCDKLSRAVFRERVRCVPCLLARKCHRCRRNDRQAHLVGNRRAFRAFLVDLNFSRFASGSVSLILALYLSVFP
jgi:hypothetical protein